MKENTVIDILNFCAMSPKKEEMEVGRICLYLYEEVEDALKKLGIRIALNVYDGADVFIYENKGGVKNALNTVLYCLIKQNQGIKKLNISVEKKTDRVWIILGLENQVKKKPLDMNAEQALYFITDYLNHHDILIKSNKIEGNVGANIGIGFRYKTGED